jgi:hypothetical protein
VVRELSVAYWQKQENDRIMASLLKKKAGSLLMFLNPGNF